MVHFVYLKNCTADKFSIRVRLKLWGLFPRTIFQTVGAHSIVFVPNKVQKKPFLLEILHDNQSLHTMEVSGYCELTVSATEDVECTSHPYSVTVRLPDEDITEDATLLKIMQMQNYYDILQVNYVKFIRLLIHTI